MCSYPRPVLVDAPVHATRQQLIDHLGAPSLDVLAGAAIDDATPVRMRARVAWLSKQVEVRSMPPYDRGPTLVIPLRWVATGPLGQLFPALDANLEVAGVDRGTRLSLIGSYRPPLGQFGEAADHLALHDVARRTMHGFLQRLADVVVDPHPAASSERRGWS